MQVNETVSEPLHREFAVIVGASDLEAKLTGKITEIQPKLHLKGFRPGKAPVSFLKKTYGKSLMGDIVKETINETSEQLLKEREIRPATAPRVDFVNPLDSVIDGKADLSFTMKIDLMPDFSVTALSELKAQRLVSDVADTAIENGLTRVAESQKTYTPKPEGEAAQSGDAVTIDFAATIGGEPFEGGKAENFDLTLGSNAFIPGFEDQLTGVRAGEQRTVTVKFPDNYGNEKLAGKDAQFEVSVKAVKAPNDVPIDDELAKKIGLESLDQLKERIRDQLKADYGRASRVHLKRRILDALDAAHDFPLPKGMVEAEFDMIWRQVEAELKREGTSAEDEGKTEDELKAEYHGIAERRVKLGLILAKIGEQNAISINQDEVNRALAARARQFPGQEKQVIDFYINNPQAMAELRVPLFEDKVIDFLSELIQVNDRTVEPDILYLDPDEAEEKLNAARSEGESAPEPDEAAAAKKPSAPAKQEG